MAYRFIPFNNRDEKSIHACICWLMPVLNIKFVICICIFLIHLTMSFASSSAVSQSIFIYIQVCILISFSLYPLSCVRFAIKSSSFQTYFTEKEMQLAIIFFTGKYSSYFLLIALSFSKRF